MKLTLTTRRLLVSTCYASSAALFMAHIAVNAGAFTTIDLAITIVGVVPWGIAAIHGLSRRCLAQKQELLPTTLTDDRPPAIKDSTHATVNTLLHVTSSSLFIASDMIYITAPNPVLLSRLAGSYLWLKSSLISLWLARHLPNDPDANHDAHLCGLEIPTLDLIAEVEFLAAGILYAYAIWSDSTFMPLKAAGNIGWLLGCTHETLRRYADLYAERRVLPDTMRQPMTEYTPPPAFQIEPETPMQHPPSPSLTP